MNSDSPPKALTLDAAGTLFTVARPVGETYAGFAREFAIPVTVEQLNRQFRTLFPRMPPLAFGRCAEAERLRQERNWWQTLVRNCLGAHGRHAQFPAFFNRVYDYYASPQAWRLYPDCAPELERLADRGIPVSVVSNFDSRLEKIIEALGIRHLFRHIHYSSRSGSAKPQPAIFTSACERLQVAPADTLHVGDSYPLDVQGASRAGLQALWLDRSADSSGDALIHTLAGLAEHLSSR